MERVVIVGDIHGCFDELLELLDVVGLASEDVLVAVGDLVDRGPKPAEVVRFFQERPNSVALMGNHERKHVRGIFSYAQEITRLQAGAEYDDMVAWMRTLPYWFENEHVRVVHAAMVPGTALADQREEVLCGSTRGERELKSCFPQGYWHERYTDAKPVAFGHHVVGPEPLVRDGHVFGLDTGACHGGYLSALSVPDFTVYRVPAHADHWARVRRDWQLPVLKAKPWGDYTWEEIEAMIARRAAGTDDASRAWLREVERWAGRLRALVPDLVRAAHARAEELDVGQFRAHPAADLLFQARNGRLDRSAFTRRCTTPNRLRRLAADLGVETLSCPR